MGGVRTATFLHCDHFIYVSYFDVSNHLGVSVYVFQFVFYEDIRGSTHGRKPIEIL